MPTAHPMFAKRHYEAIATVFYNCQASSPEEDNARDALMGEFIAMFERDNPRFDAERFERACNG